MFNYVYIILHNQKINTNDCFYFLRRPLKKRLPGLPGFRACFVAKKLALAIAFRILLPSYVITRRKDCFGSS